MPGPLTDPMVSALRKAVVMELTAILQYQQNAHLLKGTESAAHKEYYESSSVEEMKHLDTFMDILSAHGYAPFESSVRVAVASPQNARAMAELGQEMESETIEFYASLCDLFEDNAQPGLAQVVDNILVDEQGHLQEFMILSGE